MFSGVGRLGLRAVFGGPSFSVLSLFANGEQGVWYQNSDFSTLFQDAAGGTPVTGLEQPVGLRLDKSKGLVLGSELVTNGDFSNGTTGWTAAQSASLSVVGSFLRVTNVTAAFGGADQSITTVVGKSYKLVFTVGAQTGTSSVWVGTTSGGYQIKDFDGISSGTYTLIFTATSTTTYLRFLNRQNVSTNYSDFDNISVRELPGNHAFQTTNSARPVLSARYNLLTQTERLDQSPWSGIVTVSSGISFGSISLQKLTNAETNAFQIKTQTVTTSTNTSYELTAYASYGDAPYVVLFTTDGVANGLRKGFNIQTGVVGATQVIGSGWTLVSADMTPMSASVYRLRMRVVNASSTRFDAGAHPAVNTDNTTDSTINKFNYIGGFDLRAASESPALPAYQRVGAATYGTSTVAGNPDYDTVGFPPYLIYDGGDWFQTSSINFTATDKMSVFAGVRKLSDANEGSIVELSDLPWFRAGVFNIGSSVPVSPATSNYSFGVRQTAFAWGVATSYAAPKTDILTGLFDIGGAALAQEITPRVDAVSVSLNVQDAGPAGSGNFGNWPLYFGTRGGSSLFFNGRDYGFVIVGRAVTASELTNTEDYMDVQTFGKNMTLVYSDELTTALGELITAADGDQIYMQVSYV